MKMTFFLPERILVFSWMEGMYMFLNVEYMFFSFLPHSCLGNHSPGREEGYMGGIEVCEMDGMCFFVI